MSGFVVWKLTLSISPMFGLRKGDCEPALATGVAEEGNPVESITSISH